MIMCDNLHIKNAQEAAGTNYSLSFHVHVKLRLVCCSAAELGRRGGRAVGGWPQKSVRSENQAVSELHSHCRKVFWICSAHAP